MLPAFIIEQIRRREEAERRKTEAERPRLEITIEDSAPSTFETPVSEDERDRGVVIVQL